MWSSSDYGPPAKDVRRTAFEYHDYMRCVNTSIPPGALSVAWPFIAVFFLGKKFLRPEIKMPDIAKINDLEKELNELAGRDSDV